MLPSSILFPLGLLDSEFAWTLSAVPAAKTSAGSIAVVIFIICCSACPNPMTLVLHFLHDLGR